MKKIMLCLLLFPLFVFAKEIKYKEWSVRINTDPITDKKDPSILAIDMTKIKAIDSAALLFTCKGVGLIPLSKNWKDNQDGAIKVIFRVDKQKPIEMEWVLYEGNVTAKREDFMNEALQNGKKLVVRAGSNFTRDFTFSLLGYKKAYEHFEKECAN